MTSVLPYGELMAELSDPTAQAAADLAERLAAILDGDPAYERQGGMETTPWGTGQWMKFTDPEGVEHFMRVAVEPPPD